MSASDREPTKEEEAAARAREKAEQDALPYKWTQSIGDLDISFTVPGNLKGRDLVVEIKKDKLKAGIKGQTPVIDGDLPYPIKVDESSWTLTSAPGGEKLVEIHLDKSTSPPPSSPTTHH
jgi:hypothetical protein